MTAARFVVRATCPGCDAAGAREIFACRFDAPPIAPFLRSFYAGEPSFDFGALGSERYVLDECTRCGLVFQRIILGPEGMADLYERWIDPDRARGADAPGRETILAHARDALVLLRSLDRDPQAIRVLDFGMGWGAWCRMARGFGFDVAGVELSESRRAHARAHGIRVIEWDAIPRERFDFINTEQVLEHLADPLGTLHHLVSALADDGRIRLSVPEGQDIGARLVRGRWDAPKDSPDSLNPVSPLEHVNCFDARSLDTLAARAGLVRDETSFETAWAASIGVRPGAELAKNLLRPLVRRVVRRTASGIYRRDRR